MDVKRGAGLRLTHRVQILFYALELQALLEAEGITTARADLEHGGVWLGRQPEPEVFGLGDFRPHLEKFLRDDLMNVLEGGAAEAAWHLYPRCGWREYFDHCRAEMRRKNDVSRLVQLRSWSTLPFVDTVDKMQGQEAEAVVISYGVSDPEFALKEATFIYGLNRLNVSITRGRSKTVLCLPRPLLEATPQVLDVPAAASGLAFMRRLVALVEQSGEVLTFEGDEVEARILRAAQPLRIAFGVSCASPSPYNPPVQT